MQCLPEYPGRCSKITESGRIAPLRRIPACPIPGKVLICGVIRTQGVTKRYGDLQVLCGVDLEVQPGEIAALLGRSGSGKSTFLHLLGALDRPDAGEILIQGQAVADLHGEALNRFRNETIGFIFQFHHLLPEFTAIENAMMPGLIRGQSESDCRRRASELLDYLGLQERFDHKPGQLSGGEQQRVAVARALLNRPAVILADEPTGNLDSANSEEMQELFLRLRKDFQQTFLIATHSAELARVCDTRHHMVDGRLEQRTT
jgi:lipoprotein-releasing system ATP-binding protein